MIRKQCFACSQVFPADIVLVARDDGGERAVLVDFGIAKLFTQAGKKALQLTRTGEVFGSPLYMSPEQCMGQTLDHRSDIYSLGCMMYEILTGFPPISGENFLSTIFKHVNEIPPSFACVAPDMVLPLELERIVFKALSKPVNERFDSMSEMRKALENVQEFVMKDMINSILEISLSSRTDVNSALEAYRQRAEKGDSSAQFDLAWYHFYGDGITEDKELAFYWFMKSAEQGYAPSQRQIGYMYRRYFGIGRAGDQMVGEHRRRR
jgi:serine/threonine protein kinase